MLSEALNIVGVAIVPEWTGDEPSAASVPEKTTADFDREAIEIADREWQWDRENSRSRMEIQAQLEGEYQRQTALRTRRQAAVNELMTMLFKARVLAKVFAATGEELDAPHHIWAADGAEEIFDTGVVHVVDGTVKFLKGLPEAEERGIIMVAEADLRKAISGEEIVAPLPAPDTYRSGAQGRPSNMHHIVAEFRRRVDKGETFPSLAQACRDLARWFATTHPLAKAPGESAIGNHLRPAYREVFPEKPLK